MGKLLQTPERQFSAKSLLLRRIPILEWLPKYTKSDIVADFIAGLTVGLTMMPQAIAYANLAGLPAQYGLYTAFVGSFTYVLFGTIKEVSIGPTSLMALLTLSYTEGLPIDFVILLTFLAGCVVLLMGVFKLGFLVDFISPNITSGFTSAMSLTIVVSQLKNLLGLRKLSNHGIFDVIHKVFERFDEIRLPDTLLGFSCIAFLYAFKKLPQIKTTNQTLKKTLWLLSISKNALVVLFTAFIAYFFVEHTGTSPFNLSGDIPSGLPEVQLPQFGTQVANETVTFIEMVQTLGSGIIVIPVAAVLANVAIAKSFATGVIVDATQEMVTLGLCNIFGSFIQAMPSCGAFTRSAVASSSGVRTPLQGLYAGTIILLALSFLTPYFYYIPRATLAAVLISAIITMFDYKIFFRLWKCNKFDCFVTAGILIIGITYGVEVGILAGGILNLFILLKPWARPHIETRIRMDQQGFEYIYIKPELGLHYAGADYLTTKVTKARNNFGRHLPIVLDCANVLRIDYGGCLTIENLIKSQNNEGQKITFLKMRPEIYQILSNTLQEDLLHMCRILDDGVESSEKVHDLTTPLLDRQGKNLPHYDV